MDDIELRLVNCFTLVFQKADPSDFRSANAETLAGWDSLAHVTLLTLVGEEFGIDVDFEAFEGATSFEALATRIAGMAKRD